VRFSSDVRRHHASDVSFDSRPPDDGQMQVSTALPTPPQPITHGHRNSPDGATQCWGYFVLHGIIWMLFGAISINENCFKK
jgi:hypothetical protein